MLTKTTSLKGEITVPGDKSISHRGVMFGAISQGLTELDGFLNGADCRSTISCFREMGIEIVHHNQSVKIYGKGLYGLCPPKKLLDVGNSGTTTRLMSGILAGQSFLSTINGDESIQSRPMNRIIKPLQEMGAHIVSLTNNGCAPLEIGGSALSPITYESPVASAQVKSCILLAGMYASGKTTVKEPVLSRNHTELMLSGFGATIESKNNTASIIGQPKLYGQHITIPGDISSAAYFIAAGCIVPNSTICIKNVNINPTRDGILKVAYAMGANIQLENQRLSSNELVADIIVSSSSLSATVIEGDIIPTLIDEIPVIAIMAACATGTTIIRDAKELKVKESNRIDTVVSNLKNMGADIEACEDGMIIHGGKPLHGANISTKKDHRIAMSFAIASLIAEGETILDDPNCVNISYPTFYETLSSLQQTS